MSEFTNFFEKKKRDLAAQTATGALLNSPNPDGFAKARELGRELDIPAAVVESAPALFQSKSDQRKSTNALLEADQIRGWLTNPDNTKIAGDDVVPLTTIENWTGPAGRAVGRGTRRLGTVLPNATMQRSAQQLDDTTKSFEQIFDEVMPAEKRDSLSRGGFHRAVNDARLEAELRFENSRADPSVYLNRGVEALDHIKQISERVASIPKSDAATAFEQETLINSENTIMGTLGAFARDPIRGAAFIAETGAETLPILAAATGVTLATSNPAAGVATLAGGSFLTEQSNVAIEFLDERGIDISTPEGARDVIQNQALMTEIADRGMTRGAMIALFDAMSGGLAGKTIASTPAGEVFVQTLAQVVLGSGGEAAAQLASGQEFNAREVVIEGLAEGITAPIDIIGIGGRGIIKNFIGSEKSGQSKKALERLDESVAQSKLKDRAPDKFLEALERAGLNDQSLYVPAEDLKEYFQSQDRDNETLTDWGVSKQDFEERLASGGDVVISMADYAANISGTDDAVWLHENAVLNPDEFSPTQAANFNEEVADVYQKSYEEDLQRRQEELSTRENDAQVYDGIFSQLRAAGRSSDVAAQEASVWQAFYRTQADRTGENSLDLARRFGVTIRGSDKEIAGRRRGDLDISLNQLRRGAPKPTGESLVQFLRNAGGLQDAGGELRSFDAPKGLISASREDIQNRKSQVNLDGTPTPIAGQSLDNAARAAVESGFFPSLIGEIADNNSGQEADLVGALLEGISAELQGSPIFRQDEGPDANLTSLQEFLDELGIDISQTNDEIIAQLEAAEDGQTFSQDPFEVDGWQDTDVSVETESGSEALKAGEVEAIIAKRESDAKKLLDCING